MSYYSTEIVEVDEKKTSLDTIPPVVPRIVKNALTLIGRLPSPSIFRRSPLYSLPLARGNMEYTVKRMGGLDNLYIWNYHDDIRVNGLAKYRVVDSKDAHNYRQALFVEMNGFDVNEPYLPKSLQILEDWSDNWSSIPNIQVGCFDRKGFDGMDAFISFSPRGVEGLRRVNEMLEAVMSVKGLR
jgi:hypothetical protein